MAQIIMNAPGFMHKDNHNRYFSDEELDAILPTSRYAIVTPPPLMIAPRNMMATPIAEVGGFQIQESLDAAAVAAAAGLASDLPMEIHGVGNIQS